MNLVKTTGLHAAGKGINVAKVLKTWNLMSPLAASWERQSGWFSATVQRAGHCQPFPGCTGAHPN
ncbi:hypothetical protein ACVXG8_22820 [Escherichia coli]